MITTEGDISVAGRGAGGRLGDVPSIPFITAFNALLTLQLKSSMYYLLLASLFYLKTRLFNTLPLNEFRVSGVIFSPVQVSYFY